LKLNYRGSSLTQGEPSLSATLQPGDRAPDAPLLKNEGRLFDLCRGPHFTLAKPMDQYGNTARDEHIWNIYGVASGVLFLIRPDGYIGFIANTGSASQVKDYLRKCTRK
jgi:hypothetical protein